MPDKTIVCRYRKGGARVYVERADGNRDLVVDIYEPAERRNRIIQALIDESIIDRDAEIIDI